jgi:hypothetical protein
MLIGRRRVTSEGDAQANAFLPHRELAVRIASLAISVASDGRCVRVQQASAPNYSPTERKSK